MIIKKVSKLSEQCARGEDIKTNCEQLKNFNNYVINSDYNAFTIDAAVEGNSLLFVMLYTYYKCNWNLHLPNVSLTHFSNLFFKIQSTYRPNFYHNQVHAADVVQNLYHIVYYCDLLEMLKMTSLDVLILLLSGAAHDIDHPGNNNMFEIKSRSKLAILYNEISILENHHCASLFFILDNNKETQCDIFCGFSDSERANIRKLIIENILCTDMAKHAEI